MTVWGKMWWENSCGGWPRQNCCVRLQGHLLIWHIHNPLCDVWKAYERSILISKAHTGESNTRQQHQKQVCFCVIYSFFNPGLVYSLCSEEQTQPCLRALWSISLEHVTHLCVKMWRTCHLVPGAVLNNFLGINIHKIEKLVILNSFQLKYWFQIFHSFFPPSASFKLHRIYHPFQSFLW